MSELTTEQWQDLNAKLDAELKQAEGRARNVSGRGLRYAIAAALVVVVTIVLAIIFKPSDEEAMYFMPAGAVFAVLGWLFVRATRLGTIARHDVERIQRDIRQWKKRKPGSVFDRHEKEGLSQGSPSPQ
jgi:hypothetical protein